MKSTFEMIMRKAEESADGYYKFEVSDKNQLLGIISVGIGDNYLSETTEYPVTLEVWINTRKPLEEVHSNAEISTILKYESILGYGLEDDNLDADSVTEFIPKLLEERIEDKNKWGGEFYNYHLEFFPRPYLADIFPSLYPKSIEDKEIPVQGHPAVNTETGEVVTFEKGSLAEFAASHGCDYMDMSSMTLYRGL